MPTSPLWPAAAFLLSLSLSVLPAEEAGRIDHVEGWRVHVSERLLAEVPAETTAALEILQKQLAEIARLVPEPALGQLREVPLWFSPEYPNIPPRAEYHEAEEWLRGNGRNPAMAHSVEFTNIRIFAKEWDRMPNFVLHELAHSYHQRVLGKQNPEVLEAYRHAVDHQLYAKVERWNGSGRPATTERAYAITNVSEYFAENTEAFFGRNDFYPFTRTELHTHDPMMEAVLAKVWGAK